MTKLEPFPDRFRQLPIDERGYPVPWFVAWIDGKPEFRAADQLKWVTAIKESRCWVCGDIMGAYKSFVIGPMCGINRVTSEPPCHFECAEWSARNCPFLSNPNMIRNENNLEGENPGGIMIKRNPGVSLIWTTKKFKPFRVHNGRMIEVGEPESILFYARGRRASLDEIFEAIESGCPALERVARYESPQALLEFMQAKTAFLSIVRREHV